MRLFRRQLHGLHPPHCLGATSDLQLSVTGSYQGFGAGLCSVIENIGYIVFSSPLRETARGPRLGYHKSHTETLWDEQNHTVHTHTHRRIIIYSWHLLLGSLGSNALSYHSTKTASWLHWLLGHYATLDQQSQLVRLPAAPCLICFYNYTFFISPGLTQWHQRCL